MRCSRPALLASALALAAGCASEQGLGPPAPAAVEPASGFSTGEMPIQIVGDAFYVRAAQDVEGASGNAVSDGFRAWLGDVELSDVRWADGQTLTATVPAGLAEGMYPLTLQSPFGTMSMAMNGNLNFAQNAVEQMTGDNNLIAVRSRAVQNRPFTLVKRMQAEAEANYRSKIKELEDSLADTQKQLNDMQLKKEKGQRFILSPEQQAAVENFRKKEADVKIRLKEERKKLRRDIDSLENRLKWFNIATVPLIVTGSGIGLAFLKRKRTSAK